jgi:hypothetical protein
MRKFTKLAAAAILGGISTVSANAGIQISSQRATTTSGGDALFDVIRFYAKLDVGGPEVTAGATGLSLANITMTSSQQFKFGFTDRTGDGIGDWDPIRIGTTDGTNANSPLTNNANTNTFIAVRPYDAVAGNQGGAITPPGGLNNIYPEPSVGPAPQDSQDNDGDQQLSTGDFDPRTIYQSPLAGFPTSPGLKGFRVEVFNSIVDPSAMPGNANYNRGALFAVAVVPKGTAVTITGSIAADKGNQQAVNFTDGGVPEPTSLGLAAVGAVGMLARRRRKA